MTARFFALVTLAAGLAAAFTPAVYTYSALA